MPRKKTLEEETPKKKRGRPRKVIEDTLEPLPSNSHNACTLCSAEMTNAGDLATHVVRSHGAALKFCPKCGRAFIDAAKLEQHQEKHVSRCGERVACARCPVLFTRPRLLEAHDRERHRDSRDGMLLDRLSPYLSILVQCNFPLFVRNIINNNSLSCRICNFTSNNVKNYIKHLDSCKRKRLVVCDCSCVFKKTTSLKEHHSRFPDCKQRESFYSFVRQSRYAFLEVPCKNCGKNFRASQLESHKETCTSYVCTKCDQRFTGHIEYSDHYMECHQNSLKIRNCPYCRMEFISKARFDIHVKVHEKYNCLECGKKFRTPKPLLAHLKKNHPNVEPYKCVFCEVTFKDGFDFKNHITTHTEKGFINFDDGYYITFSDRPKVNPVDAENEQEDEGKQKKTEGIEGNENDATIDGEKVEEKNNKLVEKQKQKQVNNRIDEKEIEEKNEGEKSEEINSDLSMQVESTDDNKTIPTEVSCEGDQSVITMTVEEIDNAEDTDVEPKVQRKTKKTVPKPQATRRSVRKTKNKKIDNNFKDYTESSSDEELMTLKQLKMKKMKSKLVKMKYIKKSFRCTICNKKSFDLINYNRHINQHFRAGAKQCMHCAKILPNRALLDAHLLSEHQPKKGSRLHEFLKARAKAKLEQLQKTRNVGPVKKPIVIPPLLPFKMVLTRVVAPTYEAIQHGVIRNTNAVKIVRTDEKMPEQDWTVQSYVESFQGDEKPNKKGPKPLTTNKHLKFRTVRMTERLKDRFRIFAKKYREPKPPKNPGLNLPKPFKRILEQPVTAKLLLLEAPSSDRITLNYGVKIASPEYEPEHECGDTHRDDDYAEPPTPVVRKNTKSKSTKGKFTMEVSLSEEAEIESKLEEVCNKLELDKKQLNIGYLTTSAPYYSIVNVKQVMKEKKKKEREENLQKKYMKMKIDNTDLVPVNPFSHLLPRSTFDSMVKKEKKPVQLIDVSQVHIERRSGED